MYLSSYVLASRSSDVSSQFGRLQSDQLQLETEGEKVALREKEMVAKGWADSEEIRRAEPEGKGGADFYANICETLCHGEASHTRGMSTRPPRRRRKRRRKRKRSHARSWRDIFRQIPSSARLANFAPTSNRVRLP